jgi:hypothetical protein
MRLVLGFAVAAAFLTPHPASAQFNQFNNEVSCTVGEVAVYPDRVHVFCSAGGGQSPTGGGPVAIRYFSVEIGNPLAAHAVAIASAATVHGRPIAITFDHDASDNPAGCLPGDCRRLVGIKGFGG